MLQVGLDMAGGGGARRVVCRVVIDYVGAHTILSCLVGSRAYGLAGSDSDRDRRGVYAAPAAAFWPLDKPPTHLDGPATEQFSWEVERFCGLALTANPTVLEVLWSPHVDTITDEGRRLVAVRRGFLSTRVAHSYGRYARDQMRRVDARRTATGETNHKQAMHMIRLLLAGTHVLRTGEVLVDVTPYREGCWRSRTVCWPGPRSPPGPTTCCTASTRPPRRPAFPPSRTGPPSTTCSSGSADGACHDRRPRLGR